MLPFERVLVTGGAGFIGSHLVDRLIYEGCKVVVFDDFSSGSMKNLEASSNSRSLTIVKGKINERPIVERILRDIEVVFHEAALPSTKEGPAMSSQLNHVNVFGTINLLECALKAGVSKFVFASSAEVYGNSNKLPMTEDQELLPVSPNGWSKLQAEKACLEISQNTGMKTTSLRYFNVYGRRSQIEPPLGVINEFATKLLTLEAPALYGQGAHTRDYVHVEDVVNANILVASSANVGNSYNVGSGEHIQVEKLAELESRILLGDNVVIPLDYKVARRIDVPAVYGDVSLIKRDTGFSPKFSIQEGLEDYLPSVRESVSKGIERPIPVRK
jgi:nucleoside-diphosphate-sugar epimerase